MIVKIATMVRSTEYILYKHRSLYSVSDILTGVAELIFIDAKSVLGYSVLCNCTPYCTEYVQPSDVEVEELSDAKIPMNRLRSTSFPSDSITLMHDAENNCRTCFICTP